MAKGLLVDVTKCFDCGSCTVACQDEHFENSYMPYTLDQPELGHFWMKVSCVERGTWPKVKVAAVPMPCMHCDDAPCVKAASGGAVTKRSDGIVLIDPVKSAGQTQLVASCPYGRIYWNDKLNIPQKCTLCAHRVDAGGQPKCVLSCPSKALTFGEYENLMKTPGAEALHPEFGTKPKVLYLMQPKTFIAGKAVDSKGEVVIDADASALDLSTLKTSAVKSDYMGDFWLDGLTANRTYRVKVSKAGMATVTRLVSLYKNTDLGDVKI